MIKVHVKYGVQLNNIELLRTVADLCDAQTGAKLAAKQSCRVQ